MQPTRISPAATHGKRIFLRADLNVPLDGSNIADDQRLKALLPTLTLLEQHAASIVIATHLGRPNPTAPDQDLSTKQLMPWFVAHGFSPVFANNPAAARQALSAGARLVLLENLRFFQGEEEPTMVFATSLATFSDLYVTEAFGTLHRGDASIALLPTLFPIESRFYGLLIAQEFEHLTKLRNNPAKPFVAVLGGSKLTTKLPLIERLMSAPEAQRITHLLLGGLLGEDLAATAPQLAAIAQQQGIALLLPSDHRTDAAGANIDIGPATEATFVAIITQANTIFANGTMGKYEQKNGEHGTCAVLQAIAANQGFTVIGGGDCGAAAAQCGVADKVSFVSTGGGATLAYLASNDPWVDLPGLRALTAAPLCE